MMPDMVTSHVGPSYCDSHFPSISTANPAQQYSLYSHGHSLYQGDSNQNTYQPSPTPLPEISEFLREETRRTSDSTSQSRDTFTEFVELRSKVPNDVSPGQKSTNFANDKSERNKKVQTKRSSSASSLSEPHRHSHKKKIREEKLKRTENLNQSDSEQLPHYESLSYSVVQTKVGDFGLGAEIQDVRNYNSIKPPTSFSPSYVNLDGPSNTPAYQSVITKYVNGAFCNKKPNDLPSFTSMIFDDDICVSSSLHVFPNTEKESQSFSPSRQESACQDFIYPCESQRSFFEDVGNGSEEIYESSNNVYYEMCSTGKNVMPADVNPNVCHKDKKKNPKREMFMVESTELASSVKKDPNIPNKKFNSFGQTNQSDLKEITWEDAKSHTQQNDLGLLQVQSNGVLEDIDLCEVDSACMEYFEREYQKEAIKEMELACSLLNIPTDANIWTELQVDKWIMWTVHQCHLPAFDMTLLRMSGEELCKLGEEEMLSRVPTCGDIIHARLRIWKSASKMIEAQAKSKNHQENTIVTSQKKGEKVSKKETENKTQLATGVNAAGSHETDNSSIIKPPQTSSIHLWMFLKELLLQPQMYGRFIRWIDKDNGVFKIEDSVEVARLWGVRKNRPAMNYDKLSRSIRQYYKKGIIKKTTVSQRLVYQFVNPSLSVSL